MSVTKQQIKRTLTHYWNECHGQMEDGRYILDLLARPDTKKGRQLLVDVAEAVGCEYKPSDHGCYYYLSVEQAEAHGLTEDALKELAI